MARALKAENPGRTAAQVARILRQSAGSAPSERTLQRLFLAADLAGQARKVPAAFGRFEASRPNELRAGDALHGPHLGGRKTYLFAFIDDHSRAVTGHRSGFAGDSVRLAAALRPALAARGIPEGVYADNGSAFVDAALLRSCASLGIRLVHSAPGRPQGRGKIERFFRTVRDQFLAGITGTGPGPGGAAEQGRHYAGSLDELNTLFTAWVETVCHRAVHSETGQPPLERYSAGPPARHPAPGELREAFLWSERRKVTKTATVSLHGNACQVDPLLAGMHAGLLFDPSGMTAIEVRHDGAAAGTAIPHVISRHSHPKARPEQPGTPPPATGIDYTAMIAAAHDAALAGELVSYAGLGAVTGTSGQLPGQLTIDQALDEEHA
jgi:putative transposase